MQPRPHVEALNCAQSEYRLEGIETIISLHARLPDEDAFHSSEYLTDYPEEPLRKK